MSVGDPVGRVADTAAVQFDRGRVAAVNNATNRGGRWPRGVPRAVRMCDRNAPVRGPVRSVTVPRRDWPSLFQGRPRAACVTERSRKRSLGYRDESWAHSDGAHGDAPSSLRSAPPLPGGKAEPFERDASTDATIRPQTHESDTQEPVFGTEPSQTRRRWLHRDRCGAKGYSPARRPPRNPPLHCPVRQPPPGHRWHRTSGVSRRQARPTHRRSRSGPLSAHGAEKRHLCARQRSR